MIIGNDTARNQIDNAILTCNSFVDLLLRNFDLNFFYGWWMILRKHEEL